MADLKIKTPAGFKVTIDDKRLESHKVLEAMAELKDGDILSSIKALKAFFGSDYERLKEFCEKKYGEDYSITDIMQEFTDCINAIKDSQDQKKRTS